MSDYGAERARQKRAELLTVATAAVAKHASQNDVSLCPEDAEGIGRQLIEGFVSITPPADTLTTSELVTLKSGSVGVEGGKTVKPGNVILDMKKLATSAASNVLMLTGAIALPWTIPFAALVVLDSVWSTLQIELSQREAAVLWTMWQKRDNQNNASHDDLLEAVNEELTRYGRGPVTMQELDKALGALEQLGCIERSQAGPRKWYLRERVKVSYR